MDVPAPQIPVKSWRLLLVRSSARSYVDVHKLSRSWMLRYHILEQSVKVIKVILQEQCQ